MTRDMDLVREILLAMDSHEHGYAPQSMQFDGFTDEQIGYHVYIMGQANLLEVADASFLDGSSPKAIPISLTWAGHEFLANARETANWLQAKKMMQGAGQVSFQIWQAALSKVVMNSLGL